jgi:hypothetical protein
MRERYADRAVCAMAALPRAYLLPRTDLSVSPTIFVTPLTSGGIVVVGVDVPVGAVVVDVVPGAAASPSPERTCDKPSVVASEATVLLSEPMVFPSEVVT